MSTPALTYRGTVYPWHCDHMGHMNVMWYVGKFDEATWHLCSLIGLTPAYLREAGRLMVAVDQHTSYRREVLAGDVLSILTETLEVGTSSIRFCHDMRNEATGETVATTILKGVHLDSGTRRSCPLPEPARLKAQELVTGDPERWAAWPPLDRTR